MIIYHYTHLKYWENIKRGSYKSKYQPGLGASLRLGTEFSQARDTTAVFALLEPQPDSWVNNKHFKDMWSHLKRNIGPLLLEIDIDSHNNNVCIVDRAYLQGYLDGNPESIPKKYKTSTRVEGEEAYFRSMVTLDEYLERISELEYSLPEVVVKEDIPFERIHVSESQPLLQEMIESERGEYRESIIRAVKGIAELESWYKEREGIFVHQKEQRPHIRR